MNTKLISIRDQKTDMAIVDVVLPESATKEIVTEANNKLREAYLSFCNEHGDGYGFPWETETILAFKACGVSASPVAYDEILYFDIDN